MVIERTLKVGESMYEETRYSFLRLRLIFWGEKAQTPGTHLTRTFLAFVWHVDRFALFLCIASSAFVFPMVDIEAVGLLKDVEWFTWGMPPPLSRVNAFDMWVIQVKSCTQYHQVEPNPVEIVCLQTWLSPPSLLLNISRHIFIYHLDIQTVDTGDTGDTAVHRIS